MGNMSEIYIINIEWMPNRQKLLEIPEIIEVPRGTVVQWNINKNKNFEPFIAFKNLIFTLYFSNKSPFYWKRTFIQLNEPQLNNSQIIRLAEDVADKKGDYKYGVSIFDTNRNETLYDEDPILRVF